MTEPSPDEPGRSRPPRTLVQLITLLAMLGVWSAITVGIAFDVAEVTPMYQYLTMFILLLASRYWGAPMQLLTGSR